MNRSRSLSNIKSPTSTALVEEDSPILLHTKTNHMLPKRLVSSFDVML